MINSEYSGLTQHWRGIRAGRKFNPFIIGIYPYYNSKNFNRSHFNIAPYVGFYTQKGKVELGVTYQHSIRDEDWTSHSWNIGVTLHF